MKILVFAKPGAHHASIAKIEGLAPGFDACFSVAVKEPAEDGRVNHAIEIRTYLKTMPARVARHPARAQGAMRRQ